MGSPPLARHQRFELVARIGNGAYGEVFEAVDRERGTRVALKALRHSTPQSILRFKREFRELVSLHHPNLVSLDELFEHAGRWFFSMELVEGVDFARYVRAERVGAHADTLTLDAGSELGFDPERLVLALVQLGRGLHALHAAGKIHRDVKPSNIRVRPDGRLVLLDFGLVAPCADDLAFSADSPVGTVGYMAPEQARGEAPSPAADSYAVGVLLYEALTGHLPFTGSALEVLQAKQAQPVLVPPPLAAMLPPALVDLCEDLCRLDPSHRPSAAELIARVAGMSESRALSQLERDEDEPAPRSPPTVCLGRQAELELLERALARASGGELCKVRLLGPAGQGKTALLRAFRAHVSAHVRASVVLSGSCQEPERVAHKAFDAAIDELGRKLERLPREQCARLVPKHVSSLVSLFPVLGRLLTLADGDPPAPPPDPVTQRLRAYAALRDLLHRFADRTPVVLILDDLQWSDQESLELLWTLIRPPDPPPMLLLAAMRPAEAWPSEPPELRAGLRRVLGGDDTLEIALPPLPASAAIELADRLLQSSPESAAQLAEAAGYQPLFIERLARASSSVAGGVHVLDDALWCEITALSEPARHVVELLAVAGSSLPERTLADASGLAPDQFASALAELRRERLASAYELSGQLVVTHHHAQVSTVLLAHLDEARLRQHHLSLAGALTRGRGRDPEALALHWQRAGRGDEAAHCFVQAAELAERARAHGHAAALYRSALAARAVDAPNEERRNWRKRLATALAYAGRSAEAAEAYLAAAEGSEPQQARELLCLAAQHFLRAGMTERGVSIARPLLAEVGEHLPAAPMAMLSVLWQRACSKWRNTRVQNHSREAASDTERYACDLLWTIAMPLGSQNVLSGLHLLGRGLTRALRLQDPARLSRAFAAEALYVDSETLERELHGRGLLATADDLARRSGDPYLVAFCALCRGSFRLLNGEPALALSDADEAAQRFEDECESVAWEIGSAHATALGALAYLGRFRELESRFLSAVEEAETRGNLHGFATLVTLNRCTIDLVADRVETGREQLNRASSDLPPDWHMLHAFALGAHVMLDLYSGGDAAHHRLAAAWGSPRHRLVLWSPRFRFFFTCARGLAALSALLADPRKARKYMKLVRACAATLAREGSVDAQGGAHMLSGQLAAYRGERAAAIAHYERAVELWERVGMYGRHIAKLRLGELLGGSEGDALISGCMAWAQQEGIVRPEHFFRILGPVSGERHRP